MNALVIIVASLFTLISISLWINTRQRLKKFAQLISQQQTSIPVHNQLSALNAASIGLGERFVKMQKEVQALTSRIDDLQLQVQTQTPYAQAIQLIQRGHSSQDLVELCNISFNEAQLLVKLHQQEQAA